MPLAPFIPDSEIPAFLKNHERVVLAYTSHPSLSQLHYPIFRYGHEISFRLVNTTENLPGCEYLPCFKAFQRGTEVSVPQPGESSIQFSNWCELLLTHRESIIRFPDQLRAILNIGKPIVLDVRPDELPSDAPLYVVSPSALADLNLSVQSGYFLYRPKDRQLVPFQGRADLETPIKNGADNYQTREFFMGYYVDANPNGTELDTEVQILLALSKKHSDKFDFVLFGANEGKNVANAGKLTELKRPYAFAFRSANQTIGRWFIQGQDALDEANLDGWLSRIANGTEPYSVLSAVLPYEGPDVLVREVNALNVEENVIDRDRVTLLLSAATWCKHCKKFRPILAAAAELLKEHPVRFFWINTPGNDAPAAVPSHAGFPTLFVWPAGDNYTTAEVFKGRQSVTEVFNFIQANRGSVPALPALDDAEVLKKLAAHRASAAA